MEKFNPNDKKYEKAEDLPQEKQEEFVNVEGGFVRKGMIESQEKAERMAHVEHSVRSKIDEAVQIAMAEVKKRIEEKATKAGEVEGYDYDVEKELETFRNIEDLQIVDLPQPDCCTANLFEGNKIQNIAYQLLGAGKVSSGNFMIRDCSNGFYLVKDKRVFRFVGYTLRSRNERIRKDIEYFNSLEHIKLPEV